MRRQVCFPLELVRSRDIGPMEKLLYLAIEASGPRSINELAKVMDRNSGQITKACTKLVRAGWVRLAKRGRRFTPVPVVPKSVQSRQAKRLTQLLKLTPQKGEFLMKRWLDLLVFSDDFVDNARPLFLQNPATDEPLEYDRYYLDGVAFEFNGPQHYGPTPAYPSEQAFRDLRTRDLLKKAMSLEHGVVLVEVTADDLSLDGMRRKIPECLALNTAAAGGLYVRSLERASEQYRSAIGGQARAQFCVHPG